MDKIKLMMERHSVRQYDDRSISEKDLAILAKEIGTCNTLGNLHFQLVINEPKAFDCFKAHYGKFKGVKNYIVLIGKKSKHLDELCGYYGERLVLKIQELGMNSCWVAMTYKKIPSAFTIEKGEKLVIVIPFGYGLTSGVEHKIKKPIQVSNISNETPDWFNKGVEAALLAPTAMNQQKFKFSYKDNEVYAKAGVGFYTKVDLGIAKYHFELGSNKKIDFK